MRSMRHVAALLLLFALVPGASEALENLVHLAGFGHAPHAVGTGHEHEPSGSEHGCSATFHLCSCCAQVTGDLGAASALDGGARILPAPDVPVLSLPEVDPSTPERPPCP